MDPIKIAFSGFRHGHILALLDQVQKSERADLVAAAEDDPATRNQMEAAGKVHFTHESLDEVFEQVECDVVAIGDYYGKRGKTAIKALEAGKHVILDKPICTRLEEWQTIAELASSKKLAVGCQLDLRSAPVFQTMREIIQSNEIGEILTVSYSGQHPLLLGSRPAWYFEPGKHGGTINDISIHAIDLIPWMTGQEIVEATAARAWNGKTPEVPHFQDCAQMFLRLSNGGGLLGDVSYLAPDCCGYSAPQYWRVTCHGNKGVIEGTLGAESISVATHEDTEFRSVPARVCREKDYFEDFLDEITGEATPGALNTEGVLKASRTALMTQFAADNAGKSGCFVPLS